MTIFPDSQTIERWDGSAWVNITNYCISDIDITGIGMQTRDFGDRLASPGMLTLTINNKDNVFDANIDFKRKTILKISINWLSLQKVFYFYVIKADPSEHTRLDQTIVINAVDWLGLALRNLLRNIPVAQDKRIDEAVTMLLTYAPNQPNDIDFDTGLETFSIVFDAIRNRKTTLYAELYNYAISELGYIYLRNNETLVIENANARKGTLTPNTYTYKTGELVGGALEKMDGGYLRLMSGGKILFSKEVNITIGPEFPRPTEIKQDDGEVINKIVATVKPRQVDFGVGNIYQLYTYNLYNENPPISIPAGATIVIEGGYPETTDGKVPDSAIDVIEPVYPDYFGYNLGPDGADDLVHNFVAGADSWKWEIINNGPSGAITSIEFFGRHIFNQQPLSHTAEDEASQLEHDVRPTIYDLVYRQDIQGITDDFNLLLSKEKDPKKIITSISFCANLDNENMANFMLTDIGHLRHIVSMSKNTDKYVFVQGIESLKITIGGNIFITYKVKELDRSLSLSPIAIRYSGVNASKNVLIFDPLPKLENLIQKTISLWVYPRTIVSGVPFISKRRGTGLDDYGWEVWMLAGGGVDGMIQYLHSFSTNWGIWQTPLNTMNSKVNTWCNIIIKFNSISATNNPIIKVAGVLQTLTETETPVGTSKDDSAIPIHIGNQSLLFDNLIYDFWGSIKDIRIYNRITSDAEDALIVAGEDDYTIVPDFIFNAPFVETDELADYINNPITPSMKIFYIV